jgi:acetyl-CoA carboxylase carboxyltransferase component
VTVQLDVRARVPGTIGVAVEELDGRRAVVVRSRPDVRAGAWDETSGNQVAEAADLARSVGLPLVLVLSSAGADVREGVPSLHAWGAAALAMARCSGIVPMVAVLAGPLVSGPALLLGLVDVVVATEDAFAYVVGPGAVATVTGEQVTATSLGGAGPLARWAGVVAAVVPDEEAALGAVAGVLAFLPDHADSEAPRWATDDAPDRTCPELDAIVPASPTGSFDVRDVARSLADDGELLELWGSWSANLVTGLATIDGHPVGIVANQPVAMAGTIDIGASQKGARFVDLCDAFNLPIVTLVDTPGFMPGKDLEWRGMIRHGAQLVAAYARASVPRVCVILRKAYGGAYIVMDCKTMGNDLCLAWPSAEIAVMGAKGAVEILHRRATPEERAAAEEAYGRDLVNPWVAAERGLVDAVVAPSETRRELVAALAGLRSMRELLAGRAHDNGPL